MTGIDHVVTEFSFGGMPHDEAEKNMRLFASRVLPLLQRDAAFATPPAPTMATLRDATKTDLSPRPSRTVPPEGCGGERAVEDSSTVATIDLDDLRPNLLEDHGARDLLYFSNTLGIIRMKLPAYNGLYLPKSIGPYKAASCGDSGYSLNCAARHLTAAGTPSVATMSRNFWPNSVLVA